MLLSFSIPCEARKRAETYLDHNGVRRTVKTHKIYLDYKALNEFKRKNPIPKDGRAYDVDHIKPLNKVGADKPSNMQWITVEEHIKKTARESRNESRY
jgi:hypothetical protein